jgi:carbon-monoxide dehydrogenase small subunit
LRLSCLTLAEACDGCRVETTAGLASDGAIDPLQQAFVDAFAVQCGFCTPGMIMASVDLINRVGPGNLDEKAVREGLEGNICRCTGYHNIVQAVLAASKTMAKGAKGKGKAKAA